MKLHELNSLPEAKNIKRVGRGPGSGMGKTSTRGEKDKKLEVAFLLNHGLKEDKAHYIEEFLREDLIIRDLQLDMLLLI